MSVKFMSQSVVASTLLALVAAVPPLAAQAQSAPADKKQLRADASRERSKASAKAPAPAVETISEEQLAIAEKVYTGPSNCEFRQQVRIEPIEGKPGTFKVNYRNTSYRMVPEETTSGAVRLMDKKAGVVWIQIPSKSMLMNSKAGQRLVDNCMHEQQLSAEASIEDPQP